MIIRLNGRWIFLVTAGAWFYWLTTQTNLTSGDFCFVILFFYFADRIFFSWESKEFMWCISQGLNIQRESHRDYTCCPLTSDLFFFHRNNANAQVCPLDLGEQDLVFSLWCKKARGCHHHHHDPETANLYSAKVLRERRHCYAAKDCDGLGI